MMKKYGILNLVSTQNEEYRHRNENVVESYQLHLQQLEEKIEDLNTKLNEYEESIKMQSWKDGKIVSKNEGHSRPESSSNRKWSQECSAPSGTAKFDSRLNSRQSKKGLTLSVVDETESHFIRSRPTSPRKIDSETNKNTQSSINEKEQKEIETVIAKEQMYIQRLDLMAEGHFAACQTYLQETKELNDELSQIFAQKQFEILENQKEQAIEPNLLQRKKKMMKYVARIYPIVLQKKIESSNAEIQCNFVSST
ncbi:hypothetical protein HK096_008937 [Nowakowskiella sp. JEL0078]|nr:hypothetical protein HK096_008937 [Nowakowskiella sp. JEL0078]